MKIGRTFAVGLFVFVVAVTPLGSLLNGGVFETWLRSENGRGPVRVLVHDQTGLVTATATYPASFAERGQDRNADPRLLVVPWNVCGGQADLTFARTATGYVVEAPSSEAGWCSWFTASTSGFTALSLRAPVDATVVANN